MICVCLCRKPDGTVWTHPRLGWVRDKRGVVKRGIATAETKPNDPDHPVGDKGERPIIIRRFTGKTEH